MNHTRNPSHSAPTAPRFGLHDVVAGVSVAIVTIPQSLALAAVAGLPPVHGLFAAAVPPVAAAFFVSSPHLQTGPVATTSLLTFGALAVLATPGSPEYIALAALLALGVGLVRVAIGLARAGWVAYLMSRPMLIGFTTGAAILIVASQIPLVFGLPTGHGNFILHAAEVLADPGRWDLFSIAIGTVTLGFALGGRRLHPRFPGVLVAVAIGIIAASGTGYEGAVVGTFDAGWPGLPHGVPWPLVPRLMVSALVIALVGFAEAAAISRSYAAQDRQEWNPDQEFVSQGVANVAAGMVGGFPVGGSFSRTSLNRMAGGRTRWSGAVTGLAVIAFLPFASILANLPRAVLGAIVIAAVGTLIQFRTLVAMIRFSWPQAAVAWVTLLATLIAAPRIEVAVFIGVAFAWLVHFRREMHVDVAAEVEGTTLRLRPTGVLFFGSAPVLDRVLVTELAQHPDVTRLVIDLSALGRIDYSGAILLKRFVAESRAAGLNVTMTGAQGHAVRILGRVMGDQFPSVAATGD